MTRPSGSPVLVLGAALGVTFGGPFTVTAAEDPAVRHAREILSKAPLIDGGRFARVQLEQIDIARRMIAAYPDDLELCLTAADVERAHGQGRIASLIGMEGGHVIENSLGALRAYFELGARYMTLTHNVTLDWADAALGEPRHNGLAPSPPEGLPAADEVEHEHGEERGDRGEVEADLVGEELGVDPEEGRRQCHRDGQEGERRRRVVSEHRDGHRRRGVKAEGDEEGREERGRDDAEGGHEGAETDADEDGLLLPRARDAPHRRRDHLERSRLPHEEDHEHGEHHRDGDPERLQHAVEGCRERDVDPGVEVEHREGEGQQPADDGHRGPTLAEQEDADEHDEEGEQHEGEAHGGERRRDEEG